MDNILQNKEQSIISLENFYKALTNNNLPEKIFQGQAREILTKSLDTILCLHTNINHENFQSLLAEASKAKKNITTNGIKLTVNPETSTISFDGTNKNNLNFNVIISFNNAELQIYEVCEYIRNIDADQVQNVVCNLNENYSNNHVNKNEKTYFYLPEGFENKHVFDKLWCSVAESSLKHAVAGNISNNTITDLKNGIPVSHSEQTLTSTAFFIPETKTLEIHQNSPQSFILRTYTLEKDNKSNKECVVFSKNEFNQLSFGSQFETQPGSY